MILPGHRTHAPTLRTQHCNCPPHPEFHSLIVQRQPNPFPFFSFIFVYFQARSLHLSVLCCSRPSKSIAILPSQRCRRDLHLHNLIHALKLHILGLLTCTHWLQHTWLPSGSHDMLHQRASCISLAHEMQGIRATTTIFHLLPYHLRSAPSPPL